MIISKANRSRQQHINRSTNEWENKSFTAMAITEFRCWKTLNVEMAWTKQKSAIEESKKCLENWFKVFILHCAIAHGDRLRCRTPITSTNVYRFLFFYAPLQCTPYGCCWSSKHLFSIYFISNSITLHSYRSLEKSCSNWRLQPGIVIYSLFIFFLRKLNPKENINQSHRRYFFHSNWIKIILIVVYNQDETRPFRFNLRDKYLLGSCVQLATYLLLYRITIASYVYVYVTCAAN